MTGLIESLGLSGHYVKKEIYLLFLARKFKIQMIASFFVYFEFA